MWVLEDTLARIITEHDTPRLSHERVISLLFLCEIETKEKHHQRLTSLSYIKEKNSITAEQLDASIRQSLTEITVEQTKNETQYEVTTDSYTYRLAKKALRCIDRVVHRFKHVNTSSLVERLLTSDLLSSIPVGSKIEVPRQNYLV